MAKVYDLSNYLSNEPTKIKIGSDEFAIRDGFNDLLKVDALSSQREAMTDTDYFTEFLKVTLGDQQAKRLLDLNLPTNAYFEIMKIIQSSFTGENDDDKEAGQ